MKINPLAEILNRHIIPFEENVDYYAIGDVHGCKDEYDELINTISSNSLKNSRSPIIIQLGDMIDRGPFFDTLLIEDCSNYRVMGNHEYNFIVEYYGYKQCRSNTRLKNIELLKSRNQEYQDRVVQTLTKREMFYTLDIDDRRFVFSHAPIKNIENGFLGDDVMGLFTVADFSMRSKPVDLEKIKNHNDKITYVHGHQSWEYVNIDEQKQKQKDWNSQIYNIDSNCVYGDELVALRLNDLEVFRVKSNVSVPHN